jgi:hypothetical protein
VAGDKLNLIVQKIALFAVIWAKTMLKQYGVSFCDSFSNIGKKTTIFHLSKKSDLNHPFFGSNVPVDSGYPALIVNAFSTITAIYYVRDIAQVFNAIIKSVAVNMVDVICRHFAVIDKPNKPVNKEVFSVNADLIISRFPAIDIACYGSDSCPGARIDLPGKFSGIGVIFERFSRSVCCKCFSCHGLECNI